MMNVGTRGFWVGLLFAFVVLLLTTGVYAQGELDAETKTQVIASIGVQLTGKYVYPDVAAEMVALIESKSADGDYDEITDPVVFAQTLTEDLRSVSHDRHLSVDYLPAFTLPADAEPPEDFSGNYEFVRVETLPGNIGYLDFRAFVNPSRDARITVAGAMGFLSHTDAILIDLRQNGGGDPYMVAFVSSYLFDSTPVHLNDIYDRISDSTTEYWTLEDIPLPQARMPDTPVFVLTSSLTFSGAEEFAYNLQNLERATIVGEVTGGGAHPTGCHPLPHDFGICVPFARAINPITGTNWEGVGVTPDVVTSAEEAYDTAYQLALEAANAR